MNSGSNHKKSNSTPADSLNHTAANESEKTTGETSLGNAVLNEIVRASGLGLQPGPDQESVRAKFLQVAREYQHMAFSVSPVVTALAHVALGNLSGMERSRAAQIEQFVANSIYENSETQARVRRFWDALVKTVQECE